VKPKFVASGNFLALLVLVAVFLLITLRCSPAEAADYDDHDSRRPWLYKGEVAWQMLNVVDAAQTMSLDHRCMHETNDLMGRHPSDFQVALWMTGFAVGFHYGYGWLSERDPRLAKAFAIVATLTKGYVVASNHRLLRDGCPP